MSKAFVRESDEEEDRREEPHALPVGFKNYMTPRGHHQLQEVSGGELSTERLRRSNRRTTRKRPPTSVEAGASATVIFRIGRQEVRLTLGRGGPQGANRAEAHRSVPAPSTRSNTLDSDELMPRRTELPDDQI
jgi:hypothetical protein